MISHYRRPQSSRTAVGGPVDGQLGHPCSSLLSNPSSAGWASFPPDGEMTGGIQEATSRPDTVTPWEASHVLPGVSSISLKNSFLSLVKVRLYAFF